MCAGPAPLNEWETARVHLGPTIPALPVNDMTAAVACYRDRFGFSVGHHDGGFAVLMRDDAEIHLWESSDTSWQQRDSLKRPVRSGAESFIAGTASCRIEVDEVDALYDELAAAGVLHYADRGVPMDTDFGTREFATTDVDGNLLSFFRRVRPRG
ncbi:MAG: VOC family protein [Geodermatophilaceae bacterium]|nr:VOC family protein [Geodermatophilaceae bacterium]